MITHERCDGDCHCYEAGFDVGYVVGFEEGIEAGMKDDKSDLYVVLEFIESKLHLDPRNGIVLFWDAPTCQFIAKPHTLTPASHGRQ